ncbi:hypothetical protein MCC10003_1573 [Bifidobacterium longum subsp. longum]|nr:hypothetical protein MCC10003_1573 [Bifidobacterium longum subsp. longum]
MLIPSMFIDLIAGLSSLSRRVNANSQPEMRAGTRSVKLIKKGEC